MRNALDFTQKNLYIILVLISNTRISLCKHHTDVMIFLIIFGAYSSHIFLVETAFGEVGPKITDGLLMPFFGFCAQEPLGAIYHQIMAIGKIPIGVFVVGEIRGFGNLCSKNWCKIQILSGS